jgi:hypothetical protein
MIYCPTLSVNWILTSMEYDFLDIQGGTGGIEDEWPIAA